MGVITLAVAVVAVGKLLIRKSTTASSALALQPTPVAGGVSIAGGARTAEFNDEDDGLGGGGGMVALPMPPATHAQIS